MVSDFKCPHVSPADIQNRKKQAAKSKKTTILVSLKCRRRKILAKQRHLDCTEGPLGARLRNLKLGASPQCSPYDGQPSSPEYSVMHN